MHANKQKSPTLRHSPVTSFTSFLLSGGSRAPALVHPGLVRETDLENCQPALPDLPASPLAVSPSSSQPSPWGGRLDSHCLPLLMQSTAIPSATWTSRPTPRHLPCKPFPLSSLVSMTPFSLWSSSISGHFSCSLPGFSPSAPS